MLLLASSALADIHAVAEPETQTVAINGSAAEFDGSDSYAEDPPCPVTDWAWDFDGGGHRAPHAWLGLSPVAPGRR